MKRNLRQNVAENWCNFFLRRKCLLKIQVLRLGLVFFCFAAAEVLMCPELWALRNLLQAPYFELVKIKSHHRP